MLQPNKENSLKISDFTTLTFDCYGTLIDWETGIYEALRPLMEIVDPDLPKDKVLTLFARVETRIQSEFPTLNYCDVLAETHKTIGHENYGMTAPFHIREGFGQSIVNWPAFPDTAEALAYLKNHFKLVILSNIDRTGFSMSAKKLGVEFDAVYTAEEIGSYKPSRRNFDYMLTKLNGMQISRGEILHTAQSLYHDMVPAISCELATCWIDRRFDQPGSGATPVVNEKIEIDFRFNSLARMVEHHRGE